MITTPPKVSTFAIGPHAGHASCKQGAYVDFTRENDGEELFAIIKPSQDKPQFWTYEIILKSGQRPLCKGELRLELHKTLDSVIKAVVEAFKGPRTTPRAPHHA
jgi:hypothetical protein